MLSRRERERDREKDANESGGAVEVNQTRVEEDSVLHLLIRISLVVLSSLFPAILLVLGESF